MHRFVNRIVPKGLEDLTSLALDLSINWNQAGEAIWNLLDAELWEQTKNPYLILKTVSQKRLEEVARNPKLTEELKALFERRAVHFREPGWFGRNFSRNELRGVAYFSMEFGLSEALPIYSGGLGILAGDFLKTASDLGVPVVGIGLLYQQGYFHQVLDADGRQLEAFPFNDPTTMPIIPVRDINEGWLRIKIPLPGRDLFLRVWKAQIGNVPLYLLDSNDALNSAWDRAITSTLYTPDPERRFLQEIALGLGGWRIIEELGLDVEVCHLNEGHAAFVVLARARSFMQKEGVEFAEALTATRAGNVFTTHTPVDAAFDRFAPELFAHYVASIPERLGISMDQLLGLGRRNPSDAHEPFNMAYLALRGAGFVNGVSQLHRCVSKKVFSPVFPDWPVTEVPIRCVTNGAHQASWDSPPADRFWLKSCGANRWREEIDSLPCKICASSDAEIWAFRAECRRSVVDYVRRRLVRQLRLRYMDSDLVRRAAHVLDPNALTLGFARRFTAYKRPNLLLHDTERLVRLLTDADRPVQLIIAGKAHPADEEGKRMVQRMAQFTSHQNVFDRAVFLEDYDLAMAQALVGGIDVWINTPLRPWEACGTSGMKVLSNGGLNLSERDGWWAEAHSPEVGWTLDGRQNSSCPDVDSIEVEQLYSIIEHQIVPEFYQRDEAGLPREWIERIRQSMSRLTPRFSGNRMVREYVNEAYISAAQMVRARTINRGELARQLMIWERRLNDNWKDVHFGEVRVTCGEGTRNFDLQLYLADISPDDIQVELYADALADEDPIRIVMTKDGMITGAINSHRYFARVDSSRPLNHFTPRVVPSHPAASIPLEEQHIRWFHGTILVEDD